VASSVVLSASLILMALIAYITFQETMAARRRMQELRASGKAVGRDQQMTGIAAKLQRIRIRPVIYLSTSRVTVSIWTVLAVGLLAGFLSGFFGVGGGFIRVPAMIYLLGVPSLIAVGTDLAEIIVSSGYSALRHGMEQNVVIFASFIMIFGAAVGAQFGALATQYVTGPAVRLILSVAVTVGALGAGVKLMDVLTDKKVDMLDKLSAGVMFGGMGLLVVLIAGLVVMGVMRDRGRAVPKWADTLVVAR